MNVFSPRRLQAPWALPMLLLALAGLLGAAPAQAVPVAPTVAFATQPPAAPATVTSGELIGTVVVNVKDAGGVNAPGAPVSIALTDTSGNALPAGSASLSGTTSTNTATDGSGNATFSDLIVSGAGTFTLKATAGLAGTPGVTASVTSTAFTVTPSLSLAFTQQPTNTVSQQPITPPVTVTVTSLGGNQPASGRTVTLSLRESGGVNPVSNGAVLGGATAQTDMNGVATFPAVTVDLATAYTLVASVTDGGGDVVTSAPSSVFQITPGAPAALTFTQQPGSPALAPPAQTQVPAGLALDTGTASPGVQVTVQDAAGNLVPGQAVTVALSGQPGALAGAPAETSDASGVAVFQGLTVGPVGTGYTLTARAGAASVVSTPFDVIADPPLVVTSAADDGGFGTLRTILGIAPAGSTVTFDPAVFPANGQTPITLLGGEIDVTQSVTLTAPVNGVLVSGNGSSRVFGFSGGPVNFSYLTIENGQAPGDGAPFFGNGGGIAVSPGAAVMLYDCQFGGNLNTGAGSGNGGAVYNAGALTLADCLFGINGANVASNDGGGVFNDVGGTLAVTDLTFFGGNTAGNDGGAIANLGTLSVLIANSESLFMDNHANNDGGAVANAGVFSMAGLGTIFNGLFSNGASAGGGVYNAGGTVTLTDEVISGNGANDGGGVYNAGGTTTLTGCAVTSNGANDGGGLYNAGGQATVTSCTFTANSSGTGSGGGGGIIIVPEEAPRVAGGTGLGGGLFTVGGAATLTDDIFYGDIDSSGGVSEIAGPARASFCDIQGNVGTPAAPDGSANFSADPLFLNSGGNFFGPSIQIPADSPVIGRGTRNAPAFRPTDLNGQLYLDPPAVGAVEGQQDAHVLWTNPDGRTIFWDTNQAGAHLVAGNYDPLVDPSGVGGYVARSLSTDTNGISRVLWSTPDGHVALWSVNVDGTHTDSYYGPFSDDGTSATIWQPVAVSTSPDDTSHILWDNPNGRTILWDVSSNGAFTVVGNYGGFSDDGTAATVWKAVALASGPDELSHVLFTNADHNTLLWNLDGNDDQPANSGSPATASASQTNTSTSSTYGVQSDDGSGNTLWSARALSVGEDNLPRILWNNPDGRTILWNVNPDGTFAIVGNYDPLLDPAGKGGFTAVALATGRDNRSHFAWDNPNGATFLWNLLNDGGSGTNDTVSPFFYGIFSDDGTSNTLWKAVAVSAAQAVTGGG